MHFALVLALAAGSVQGTATTSQVALPGCTVTLTSSAGKSSTTTDVDGRYRFDSLEPGAYELLVELDGLESVERSIEVVEGVNEQPPAELAIPASETITISCEMTVCQDGPPESEWHYPACSDYELDTALIGSMERGDRSALELLRSRYARSATWAEKHRIAEALLRRVPDDSVYWDELFEHAQNIVRIDRYSDEFVTWCEERLYNPYGYGEAAFSALLAVSRDPRSRALLLEALEREDPTMVQVAVYGLAAQRDLSALPAIERALERARERDECCTAANQLADYRDEQADQLAFRFLDEEERAEYLQLRNAPPEE